MRVLLVHNPEAGSGEHEGPDLLNRLRDAGHAPVYASTDAPQLTRAFENAPDVVLAAGGDGTVGAVARLMAATGKIFPLAILPVGTANNLARSLGVHGTVDEIVSGLHSETRRTLDVGTARAPWGTVKFVESVGVGLFAAMLRDAERDAQTGTSSGRAGAPGGRGARLKRMLDAARSRQWRIEADGEDLSGPLLLAAILNIAYVGPGLALAPSADPGDGHFELLLVRDEDRAALGAYLAGLAGGEKALLAIPTRRVRHVRLEWSAGHGHVDDHLWPETATSDDLGDSADNMTDIDATGSSVPVVVPVPSLVPPR